MVLSQVKEDSTHDYIAPADSLLAEWLAQGTPVEDSEPSACSSGKHVHDVWHYLHFILTMPSLCATDLDSVSNS